MSPLKPVTIHTRRGLAVLALVSMLVLPAAGWVAGSRLARQGEETDRVAELARQIQQQRVDSIRSSCLEQNARHDSTIRALDKLIGSAPAGRRERARQERSGTVLLINALAPKQRCADVVQRAAPAPQAGASR